MDYQDRQFKVEKKAGENRFPARSTVSGDTIRGSKEIAWNGINIGQGSFVMAPRDMLSASDGDICYFLS